jgi:predicted flavoprotein YhiN
VVATRGHLSFALVGSESRIDYIPFAEVKYVKEMKEAISDELESKVQSFVLQIATDDDGHNSGRIYYFSTQSQELLDELIGEWSKKAVKARAKAEASTLFRKIQFKVRQRYESQEFQSVMAVLIAAVSNSYKVFCATLP